MPVLIGGVIGLILVAIAQSIDGAALRRRGKRVFNGMTILALWVIGGLGGAGTYMLAADPMRWAVVMRGTNQLVLPEAVKWVGPIASVAVLVAILLFVLVLAINVRRVGRSLGVGGGAIAALLVIPAFAVPLGGLVVLMGFCILLTLARLSLVWVVRA